MSNAHVLIAGGGIVGLSLAHALKKQGVKATVFERDPEVGLREQGWAVSLRFALPLLQNQLDPEKATRITTECSVDPECIYVDDAQVAMLDGRDLSVKFTRRVNGRLARTSRPKLRALLAEDLDIQWGKRFLSYELRPNGVIARFEDGTIAEGTLLVGCEGAVSQVRSQLLKQVDDFYYLPITATAVVQSLSRAEVDEMRKIDPLMFISMNPDTNVFFWCSTQEYAPESDRYDVLNYVSCPTDSTSLTAESTRSEVFEDLKRRVQGFHPLLRNMIEKTSSDALITRLPVRDWIPLPYKTNGRVCLAGDAAGAMTIYRGEGVNHGVLDAMLLAESIRAICQDGADAEALLDAYSEEVAERRGIATPLSRQAAMDAHNFASLNLEESPLINLKQPPPPSLAKINAILAARKQRVEST